MAVPSKIGKGQTNYGEHMNRRDFIKTTGLAIAAATLPIPIIEPIQHAGGLVDFDSLGFDRFLAESCAKPTHVFCHPDTFYELTIWNRMLTDEELVMLEESTEARWFPLAA